MIGCLGHNVGKKSLANDLMQGLFLDILKKTQTQKNSKLKPNPEKTQGKSPKNSKSANSTRVQLPESQQKNFFKTLENL